MSVMKSAMKNAKRVMTMRTMTTTTPNTMRKIAT